MLLAEEEARALHHDYLGTEHLLLQHLLLALAREGEGVGARLLAELGVVYEALRRRLDRAALACSFCARSGLDVDHLIARPRRVHL